MESKTKEDTVCEFGAEMQLNKSKQWNSESDAPELRKNSECGPTHSKSAAKHVLLAPMFLRKKTWHEENCRQNTLHSTWLTIRKLVDNSVDKSTWHVWISDEQMFQQTSSNGLFSPPVEVYSKTLKED
ncbi:hypothetical protein Tcan_01954 [Toxocara canis]|uniref:Uncharacterized protein n=1 Tax=Toxocara canis TaxID=6265 RepID=A0A0B2UX11_TOXCA|nr:hypothetical protein Tcan_01954 [Toxocara canis]